MQKIYKKSIRTIFAILIAFVLAFTSGMLSNNESTNNQLKEIDYTPPITMIKEITI